MKPSDLDRPDMTFSVPHYGATRGGANRGEPRRRTSGYFSAWNWGGWLVALLVVNIGLALATNAVYMHLTPSIDAAVQSGAQSPRDVVGLAPALHQSATLSEVSAVLAIAELILLMGWNYRIVANLPYLNAHDQRFSPGWAVAFYFIPLAALIYPYNILQDAWKGSDPRHALEDGYTWRRNRLASLISLWWAARIFVGIFSFLVIGSLRGLPHQPLNRWDGTFGFLAFFHYVQVVERILLIWLVIQFNRRQNDRLNRLREIERY